MTSTRTALRDGTWTVPAHPVATFAARNFGVLTVRGTLPIEAGTLTVRDGRPVAGEGALSTTGVSTGIAKRDEHLRGPRFLGAAAHPRLELRALRFEPAGDDWTVPATLTVNGVDTPVTLHAQLLAAGPDEIRVRITGEVDRTTAGIRVPRLMVGHRVQVEADLTFTRS